MPDLTQITGVGVAGLSVILMWKLTAKNIAGMTRTLSGLETAIRELIVFLRNGK